MKFYAKVTYKKKGRWGRSVTLGIKNQREEYYLTATMKRNGYRIVRIY